MANSWQKRRDSARAAVLRAPPSGVTLEEIEAHCLQMPARYWEHLAAEDLAWHLLALHGFYGRIARGKKEPTAPFLAWRHDRRLDPGPGWPGVSGPWSLVSVRAVPHDGAGLTGSGGCSDRETR